MKPAGIGGTTLGNFEVLELLGAGGFGEVYRARDTKLGRTVALKVLPENVAHDLDRLERFRREAMAASALNHANICTVHDLVEVGGHRLIVMELVEGKTLHETLASGPISGDDTIAIAIQIADALGEAHGAGIIHRDIKPGNVIVTPRGRVKVLDFGVAKRVSGDSGPAAPKLDTLTGEGRTPGTLVYMAPEQLVGNEVDHRCDLFSLGVLLYEMVTGRRPFRGTTAVSTVDAILHKPPTEFGNVDVPDKLKSLILQLLEKSPDRRPISAAHVRAELESLQASAIQRPLSTRTFVSIAVTFMVVLFAVAWFWNRASRVRWVHETATPEVERLLEDEEFQKAAELIGKARVIVPTDPALEKLWMKATADASIDSVPADADVSIKPFPGEANPWVSLGKTPLTKVRVPRGKYLWHITKTGFVDSEAFWSADLDSTIQLHSKDSSPRGMVPVFGGEAWLGYPHDLSPAVNIADFFIDRYEVTNEEFKAFVDAGGYERRELWKQPFVRNGRTIPWDEAVALFRDTTGRSGPATWESGTFPTGKARHPVAGVSWYEAAAYAEFAGKSLPTAYHWTLAAQSYWPGLVADIVQQSNFRGEGTQPVGEPGTLSGSGTNDMAGNVKEWCWNESSGDNRFILGGGFGDESYLFMQTEAQSPWERRANYGFRCATLLSPASAEATAKLEPFVRDFSQEKPVSDEVFAAIKHLYTYDPAPLNATLTDRSVSNSWVHETATINAAYGGERLNVHLFLPRDVPPPWQTVVYFPPGNALYIKKFDPSLFEQWAGFVVKSGRAVVFPIYKSTFERQDDVPFDAWVKMPATRRDHVIMWSKDLARSLEYIETRKDLDHSNLAYLGFSFGSKIAPVVLATNDRFKAAVLISGGFDSRAFLPEASPLNFIPRVKLPVLMLNGRYDHDFPWEGYQLPFFRLLGTPDKDKKHIVYEAGHAIPRKDGIRETLVWFDRYMGPVNRRNP